MSTGEQERQGMRDFFKNMDATVKEMWFGASVWGAICELASVWWVKEPVNVSLGVLVGTLLALAGIWHMWKVLDTALDLGDGAQKYLTARSLLRYLAFVVVFAVLMATKWADPLAAFAALMGIKISAYLQPFVHNYKEKKEVTR